MVRIHCYILGSPGKLLKMFMPSLQPIPVKSQYLGYEPCIYNFSTSPGTAMETPATIHVAIMEPSSVRATPAMSQQ